MNVSKKCFCRFCAFTGIPGMFLVVGLILKALKYLCDLCWYSCDTKVSFYGYIAALLKLCDDHDL